MARRARISPGEAGLPSGGARRRTPGLRREEVAVLAGVGASWYQWLEQGRDITVSPQVLDAVARVLRLRGPERRHLYVLAGLNPPLPDLDEIDPRVCEGLQRLLDAWLPYPAHLLDVYWNAVAYNEAARDVFELDRSRNCLLNFFTDARYRTRELTWERTAPHVVSQFRAAFAERPDDEGLRLLYEEIAACSAEFRELWARGDVGSSGQLRKEITGQDGVPLVLETSCLGLDARPDLQVVLHTPLPGTGTRGALTAAYARDHD
ncbi:helix-turn-helix transcriptional regulator [Streptomyces sp. ODS28]|uniref:helix-turn-helix transcriptional regulator n=1 Tax=Streptomyces sp. ODS28 TaxID=3136688 RepID=UPI0031EFFF31